MQDVFMGLCRRTGATGNKIIYMSEALLHLLGYTNEEKHLISYLDFISPSDRAEVERELDAQCEAGSHYLLEYGLSTRDGRLIQVRESGEVVREDGEDYYYSELIDLAAYYALTGYYHDMMNNVNIPVFIIDTDKKILFINHATEELAGVTLQYSVGKPCSILKMSGCGLPQCSIRCLEAGDDSPQLAIWKDKPYRIYTSRVARSQFNAGGYITVAAEMGRDQEILREYEEECERYRTALALTQDIVWEYDPERDEMINFFPPELDSLEKPKPYVTTLKKAVELKRVHPDSVATFQEFHERLRKGESKVEAVVKTLDMKDVYQWTNISAIALHDEDGHFRKMIGVSCEITKEKNAQLQYIQEKEYRASIAADAIFAYEVNLTTNLLIEGNYDWIQAMGMGNLVRYSSLIRAFEARVCDEREKHQLRTAMERDALLQSFAMGKREVSVEFQLLDPANEPMWVSATMNLIKEPAEEDICGFICIKDISLQKHQEMALRKKAERDSLTGLYNREAAKLKINELLLRNPDGFSALFMVDIDNFKRVNDTFGHVYGDAVLSELSQRMLAMVRGEDVVCRIGGDEVSVFLYDMKGGVQAACKKAQEICDALRVSYASEEYRCEVSSSVGIAFAPRDGKSFAELYEKADTALYHAKNRGKNQYVVFDSNLDISMNVERRTIIEPVYHKSFAENVPEYVFKILYNSENLHFTVTAVLELLAKHFSTQRGYLLEYDEASDTLEMVFEWTADGVPSQKKIFEHFNLHRLGDYWSNFDREGIFSPRDLLSMSPEIRAMMQTLGVRSMLQCKINVKNGFQGIVGVDDLRCQQRFTDEERETIKFSAEVIGTFLSGKRTELKQTHCIDSLKNVLDHLEYYIYVVDVQTHTLAFMNRALNRVYPAYKSGQEYCYRLLFHRDSPCENCIMRELAEKQLNQTKRVAYEEEAGRWFETTAARTEWPDDGNFCLISCVDVTEFKERS